MYVCIHIHKYMYTCACTFVCIRICICICICICGSPFGILARVFCCVPLIFQALRRVEVHVVRIGGTCPARKLCMFDSGLRTKACPFLVLWVGSCLVLALAAICLSPEVLSSNMHIRAGEPPLWSLSLWTFRSRAARRKFTRSRRSWGRFALFEIVEPVLKPVIIWT